MAKASKAWYSKGSKGLFSKAGKSAKSGVSSRLTALLLCSMIIVSNKIFFSLF